jgi:hypothetical protein
VPAARNEDGWPTGHHHQIVDPFRGEGRHGPRQGCAPVVADDAGPFDTGCVEDSEHVRDRTGSA